MNSNIAFVGAPLAPSSFLGSAVSLNFSKTSKNVCVIPRAEAEAPAVVPPPPVFAGLGQGRSGRLISISYVYPNLNSTSVPAKASYSKLVAYDNFSKEYQRIGKSGGKIVAVKVANKSEYIPRTIFQ
eukprot:EC121732.1.p1 GENE.EC121732.1~~EC121732.1.p1  ORF type:complete len:127 (+),score=20.63 EC121732.1:78-458(+)